jgi:hypothetical protein
VSTPRTPIPDPVAWPVRKCAYCGTEGEHRDHSGVPECQSCWDWRKLNAGATRYWYILSLMFSSAVDNYDLSSYFPDSLGFTGPDIAELGRLLKQMQEKTEELAKLHHTEDRWRDQAQRLFSMLGDPSQIPPQPPQPPQPTG